MKWVNVILVLLLLCLGFLLGSAFASVLPLGHPFLGDDGRIQWEILATGLAAVVVAILTVSKLNEQIRQTDQLALDQRKRRARAARAVLPLALTELGIYANACINGLYALRSCFQRDGSLDRSQAGTSLTNWTPPRLPDNVLSSLKECVEFSDDAPAVAIADLIRHYQVQSYCLVEDVAFLHANDGVHTLLWANVEEAICDAAELQARVNVLFPFARSDSDRVADIDRSQVHTALFTARCFANSADIDRLAADWQRIRQFRPKPQT